MVCPTCEKVSITFDPFMYLSLPIPTSSEKLIEFLYYPPLPDDWANAVASASSTPLGPVKYGVLINKLANVKELRERISQLVALPIERIAIADVYASRAFLQNDGKLVSEYRPTGNHPLFVYVDFSWPCPLHLLVVVVFFFFFCRPRSDTSAHTRA